MIAKLTISGIAVAAGLVLAAGAYAGPASSLAPLKPLALEQSPVEQAHFWHRSCRKSLSGGWHKHVKGVGRVECTAKKCFTTPHGYKRCMWF